MAKNRVVVPLAGVVALAAGLWALPAMLAQGTIPQLVTQPVNDAQRVTLEGNIPPLARPEFDQGLVADSLPTDRMLLVLKRSPQQQAQVNQLLLSQQDKSSPNYHRWLTPQEFGQELGPADADLQAATNWLISEGFQVNRVSNGRTVIEFSGTAGLVRQVLGAEIHQYSIRGESYVANATNPQIPAALAPLVRGIASLNNFPRRPLIREVGVFSKSVKTGELTPLTTINCPAGYTCTPSTLYGLGPADFATIYNVLPLWNSSPAIDGTGQTIAIVSPSNIMTADITNFRSLFGLAPFSSSCPNSAPCLNVILDGPDPGLVPGAEVEADADVEWAGGVARNATIDLVVSQDTETTAGVDLSALYIVDNNLAPVLSASYSGCEAALGSAGNALHNALWEQAAAQGITVLVASGDSGSAGCDSADLGETAAENGLAVNGLSSTPFNVSVGGTDFDSASAYFSATNNPTTQESAESYIPEVTWNDSCARGGSTTACTTVDAYGTDLTAGSGGPSNCTTQDASGNCTAGYAKPAWQTGTGVPNDSVRDIPDISLFAGDGASDVFYLLCSSADENIFGSGIPTCAGSVSVYTVAGVGGTSLSAQVFAGIMALVNQKTGQRQGNANFVLYPLAAYAATKSEECTSNASAVANSNCVFYDITSGHANSGSLITPGNNSVACVGGSPDCSSTATGNYGIMTTTAGGTIPAWQTTAGYDLASGLGSVNVAQMVAHWGDVSFHASSTTLGLSPTTLTHGQAVTANGTVTSSSSAPTGDVALMAAPSSATTPSAASANSGIATFTLGSGGAFSGTTTALPGGTYNVFAHYQGDGTNGLSDSSPVQVTVSPEASQPQLKLVAYDPSSGQVTNPDTLTVPYDSYALLRLDVTNGSGNLCAPQGTFPQYGCPSGNVAVTSSPASPFAGTLTLNSQGFAENQNIQPAQLLGGTYAVTANYSGDNSYSPSSSTASVVISPAPSSTDLPALPNYVTQVLVGTQTTIGTSVEGQTSAGFGVAPTGTVTFYLDGSILPGTVTYTSVPPNPPHESLFSAMENITFSASGTHTITATYSGDSNYQPSTSPQATIHVLYTPTVTVSVSPQVVLGGNVVSVTIVVDTANKNLAPTGSVQCGALGGPYPLSPATDASGNSEGVATFTFNAEVNSQPIQLGIVATYPGDANYAQAQSPVVLLSVFPPGTSSDFYLQEEADFLSISLPGGSATTILSAVPSPGSSGSVALSCSIPAAMTESACSFSPASMTLVNQMISTAQLTVTTTAPHTVGAVIGRPKRHGDWGGGLLTCLALLTLGFLARRRRMLAPAILAALLLAGSLSCGGGGGGGGGGTPTTDPGTPPGMYTVEVVAIGTINGTSVSHTAPLTVSVGSSQADVGSAHRGWNSGKMNRATTPPAKDRR